MKNDPPSSGPRYAASFGYSLAANVLQSDLYHQLDEVPRAECDELIARGHERTQPAPPAASPAHGSRADVLTRMAILKIAYLKNAAQRPDDTFDMYQARREQAGSLLAAHIDELSRIAAKAESPVVRDAALLREALEALRAVMCGVGIVGKIDGYDVIRRESVIDLIDRRLRAALAGKEKPEQDTGEHPPSRHCACRLCQHYFNSD